VSNTDVMLLTPDSVLYLHADSGRNYQLRCLLHEVFDAESFRNEIAWWYWNKMQGRENFRFPALKRQQLSNGVIHSSDTDVTDDEDQDGRLEFWRLNCDDPGWRITPAGPHRAGIRSRMKRQAPVPIFKARLCDGCSAGSMPGRLDAHNGARCPA